MDQVQVDGVETVVFQMIRFHTYNLVLALDAESDLVTCTPGNPQIGVTLGRAVNPPQRRVVRFGVWLDVSLRSNPDGREVGFGGLVPLILRGIRTDPALASGPLLTTVTDMCGFFFVLSFASLLLPRLTG